MFPMDKMTLKNMLAQYPLQAIFRNLLDIAHPNDCANDAVIDFNDALREWAYEQNCQGCIATTKFIDAVTPDDEQREYVIAGGVMCPHCDNKTPEGGSVDIDAGTAFQNMFCYECGASWVDEYKLTGYTNLETATQKWSTWNDDAKQDSPDHD